MKESVFNVMIEYLKGLDPELCEVLEHGQPICDDSLLVYLIAEAAVRKLGGDGLIRDNGEDPACRCCFDIDWFPCSESVYNLIDCVPAKNQATDGCVRMVPLKGVEQ